MPTRSLVFVLSSFVAMWTHTAAKADSVIWVGEFFRWAGWYRPEAPTEGMEVTVGYGDPRNTIGQGLWITRPGVYDMTGDPHIAAFLALATDGIAQPMYVTIDNGARIGPLWYPEDVIFARYPRIDLSPLEITGVELIVPTIDREPEGYCSGIVHRLVYRGVPEPAAASLAALGGLAVGARRRQGR